MLPFVATSSRRQRSEWVSAAAAGVMKVFPRREAVVAHCSAFVNVLKQTRKMTNQ